MGDFMAKYRPTSVLVIAILHMIGGTLGVLGGLFAIVALLIGASSIFGTPPRPAPGAQNQQVREMEEFNRKFEHLQKNPPGGIGLQYGMTGVDLIISATMLASGVGLLMMQSWARLLSIAYSVCSILMHVFNLVLMFGIMIPAYKAVLSDAPKGNEFLSMFSGMMNAILIGSAIFALLMTAYPIIALIIMLKPSTAAAFRGELDEEGYPADRPRPVADDYAEPFGRRPEERYRGDDR